MDQMVDSCGMCLSEVDGTICEACGVDRSTVSYKIGRFLPPIFMAFLVASLCRVGASFLPDPIYGMVALGFAGAVASVSAVHAMGSVNTRMKLASALLASVVVAGFFALELLVLSSVAETISNTDILPLLQVFGGGMIGGIAIGWPASNWLASAPPFAQINSVTAKIPQPRLRLFTRVLIHTSVVAAIVALIIALLIVAIALFVAYLVLLFAWGLLREFAYSQWGIGKSPQQRRAEEAARKEAKRRAQEEARLIQQHRSSGMHYDKDGIRTGRTDEHGIHYDKDGIRTGRTDEHGIHYDKDGIRTGRTDEHGIHYDKDGIRTGRSEESK
jgi:ABC-type multidrug transport system fused ATPase/permease subunit